MKHLYAGIIVSLLMLSAGASGAAAGPTRLEDERWAVLNVSPTARTLVVRALGGGCGRRPRATAIERPARVVIHVRQAVPSDPETVCPMIARIDTFNVHLSSPIAGRRVVRQSLTDAQVGIGREHTMPRVIGLRAPDARVALRAQGFRVRGDRGGTIRHQRPRARQTLQARPVTVTLAAARAAH